MSAQEEKTVTRRWWHYDQLPASEPDWGGALRGDHPDDQIDFHLDLGCGRSKKGRLGIDHFADDGVDIVMDLNQLYVAGYGDRAWDLASKLWAPQDSSPAEGLILVNGRLPFPEGSIESIITHHAFEHIGDGFIRLMDECHRVLKPGGKMRVIVPLFPSHAAIADPDHKRYFTPETFFSFCGNADGSSWMESFSTPYSTARFEQTNVIATPRSSNPEDWWVKGDSRELRTTLRKHD